MVVELISVVYASVMCLWHLAGAFVFSFSDSIVLLLLAPNLSIGDPVSFRHIFE